MTFKFFTLGGRQFWEDVFYYQKWRIQKHYRRSKYRLLDSFDICRASGSFETCRKAFVKMIEVYELPRQKGKLVVLLHGLGDSKKIFKPLWRALTKEGYHVAAINYPSTRKSIKGHMDQLKFFVEHLEDVDEISFITKGTGCLVLRCLLGSDKAWTENLKIGKVINVNPANVGSDWCTLFAKSKILKFFFGPSLEDAMPKSALKMPRLPENIPLGLIFCETHLDKMLKPLKKKYGSIAIPGDLTEKDFSTQQISLKNSDVNIFDNKDLIACCQRFLKEGKF